MAVAEAVELHRVDGEDVDTALEQGIDDRAARHFQGDGDTRGIASGERSQLVA